MIKSWKLGTAFGIGIHVHWTFLLLPAWVLLSNVGVGGWGLALFALAVVLAVFGCVVLHELGHALAARRYGIRTRDITLYPIGGVARLERMSEKPWEEFVIAVAGPMVNVLIAGLLGLFFQVSGLISVVVPLPALGLAFLYVLMWINVSLVIFNLLPAFPMDGGRVLRALLALKLGQLRATQIAVNIGLLMAVLMAVVGVAGPAYLQNPMLVVVAVFVYFAGQQELAGVQMRHWQRENRPFGGGAEEFAQPAEPAEQPEPGRPAGWVYLWDPRLGTWVRQGRLGPVRPH